MDFYSWITQKYLEWQQELGARKSVSAFAEYVGVAQTTASGWMQPKGAVPRKLEHINKLVKVFGNEVYEVLGLERPSSLVSEAPDPVRAKFDQAIAEANQYFLESAQSGKELSDEEATAALSIFMARHGFSGGDTSDNESE